MSTNDEVTVEGNMIIYWDRRINIHEELVLQCNFDIVTDFYKFVYNIGQYFVCLNPFL